MLHFFEKCLGEFPIDRLVVFPILYAKYRTGVRDVAKRPEALVSKTEIEALFFFLGKPYTAERILGAVRRDAYTVVFIDGIAVGVACTLCDPSSVTGAQHGFHCDERGSFHEASAKAAWQRAVDFLKKHLKK
jgi:dienelactone hydrolase